MLFPSSSTSAVTTGSTRRRQDQVYPPAVADGGQARDGGLQGVLPGHRGQPLLQAAAPAQCGVMRAAATHTPSPTFTTSSSSALRSADCTLQFPEDRTSWRRHGDLLEDPADDQEDHHQDPASGTPVIGIQGAGQVDQVCW